MMSAPDRIAKGFERKPQEAAEGNERERKQSGHPDEKPGFPGFALGALSISPVKTSRLEEIGTVVVHPPPAPAADRPRATCNPAQLPYEYACGLPKGRSWPALRSGIEV